MKAAEHKRNPRRLYFASTFSRKARRDWRSLVRRNKSPSAFLFARQTRPCRGTSSNLYRSTLVRVRGYPSPWRKSNGITQIIDALADPIDPAKTDRFIHRFRPCNARLLRALLVI